MIDFQDCKYNLTCFGKKNIDNKLYKNLDKKYKIVEALGEL